MLKNHCDVNMDNENSLKEYFLQAIKNSFEAYKNFGARSNKKILAIHSWFMEQILLKLNNNFSALSLGEGGEFEIQGKYYSKKSDIIFFYNHKKPVVSLSFKFVTSNYSQNSNNYFENLLGESANIKRAGIGFAHFIVLRGHTPYYNKSIDFQKKELKYIETLSNRHLKKYINLYQDEDFPHKPDVLGISVIDFDDNNNPYFVNLRELNLSEDIIKILENDFFIDSFINKTIVLCEKFGK